MNQRAKELLVAFGLTPSESAVYLATFSLGQGTTREIAMAAGKERAQTHHILKRLQQLGIIESTLDRPSKFRASDTKNVTDYLLHLQERKLSDLRDLRPELTNILSSHSQVTTSSETFSIIRGRLNTYLKMAETIQSSKNEVQIILSAPGIARLYRFREFLNAVRQMSKRDVVFRIITELNRENVNSVRHLMKFCEIRHVRNQLTNASIYDKRIGSIALSLSDGPNIDTQDHVALWTNAGKFASALNSFFESSWFVSEAMETALNAMNFALREEPSHSFVRPHRV